MSSNAPVREVEARRRPLRALRLVDDEVALEVHDARARRSVCPGRAEQRARRRRGPRTVRASPASNVDACRAAWPRRARRPPPGCRAGRSPARGRGRRRRASTRRPPVDEVHRRRGRARGPARTRGRTGGRRPRRSRWSCPSTVTPVSSPPLPKPRSDTRVSGVGIVRGSRTAPSRCTAVTVPVDAQDAGLAVAGVAVEVGRRRVVARGGGPDHLVAGAVDRRRARSSITTVTPDHGEEDVRLRARNQRRRTGTGWPLARRRRHAGPAGTPPEGRR